MQEKKELLDIEMAGREEALEAEQEAPKPSGNTEGGMLPLVQALLCALLLLALALLRITSPDRYEQAAGWYRTEAVKEIELPRWGEGEETSAEVLPELPKETGQLQQQ